MRHGILMAGLALQISCSCEPQLQLRIGLMRSAGCSSLALAAEQKLFQDHNLQAELHFHDDAEAIRNAGYDVVCMNLAELLVHAPDYKILSIPSASHGADAIIARKDAGADLNILKGARIGVPAVSMGGLLLRHALRQYSLDPEDFTVLPMKAQDLREALQKSEIQLAVATPPLSLDMLQNSDLQVIFRSTDMPGMIIDTVGLRAEFGSQHPTAASRLNKVWQELDDYRAKHPDLALASMIQISGLPAKTLQEEYKILTVPEQQDYLKAGGRLLPLMEDLQISLLQSGELNGRQDLQRHLLTP